MPYTVKKWPKAESTLEPIYEVQDAHGFTQGLDYCGVTAISAITGIHCKVVTQTVQRMRGNTRRIVGMTNTEVCNVLGLLGYRTDFFGVYPDPGKRMTLQRYWHERGEAAAAIVVVRNHYIAIDYALIVDTNTAGKQEFVSGHPYALSGVVAYIEVRKLP